MNKQEVGYFGTRLDDHGHYLWKLEGEYFKDRSLNFKEIPFNPEEMPRKNKGEYMEKGSVRFYNENGFSIIAIEGSPRDERGGTKSVFFLQEDLSFEQMAERVLSIPIAKKIVQAINEKYGCSLLNSDQNVQESDTTKAKQTDEPLVNNNLKGIECYIPVDAEKPPRKSGWYYVLNPNGEIMPRMIYYSEPNEIWYNENAVNFTKWLKKVTLSPNNSEGNEAIAFAEWASDNRWLYQPELKRWFNRDTFPTSYEPTSAELYQIFLKETKITK